MGKYIVTSGQNLYDVALHIYGSIEGIVDLMMSNINLSLGTDLKSGDELTYTDDFVINADIVSYNQTHKIIPANGERQVYYKEASLPLLVEIILDKERTSTGLTFSGIGKIEIDWGDNTPLECVTLSDQVWHIDHWFDNLVPKHRKVRVYGLVRFKQLDFTQLKAQAIYLFKPVFVERFTLTDSSVNIDFLSLFDDIYDLNLSGLGTDNLCALLDCKKLMTLDLSRSAVSQTVIDHYLISLVKYYYARRSCTVRLTILPSGEYKEPARDENQNYILASGMEAVWLICNEPEWNEGGYWKFIIDNQIYTSEQ